jgi:hypothetical protein
MFGIADSLQDPGIEAGISCRCIMGGVTFSSD